MSEEIKEKGQTDTIAPSGKIEENISTGVGESVDFDIEKLLEKDPFGILPSDESKTVAEEKKERDLDVSSEVKKDVKVNEKKPTETIASSGETEKKVSEKARGEEAEEKKQSTGETVDFDTRVFRRIRNSSFRKRMILI